MKEIFSVEEFDEYLNEPTDPDAVYAVDEYSHLAGFMIQSYTKDKPKLQTGGARHGFNVISRLIRIGAHLYSREQNGNGSAEELGQILANSTETPGRIANLPNEINSEIERDFSLKTDIMPKNIEELYRLEPNTHLGTLFIFDDEMFSASMARVAGDFIGTGDYGCKMSHLTRNVLWPQAVRLSEQSPKLFAQTVESHR